MFCALLQLLPISAQAGVHCAFVEVQRLEIFVCVCACAAPLICSGTLLYDVLLGGKKKLNKYKKK